MKIVRPAQGSAGVYFPIGRKGTCEFATTTCIKDCCANLEKDYDEEIRISREEKEVIYEVFMTAPILELCDQILSEMDGLQTPVLHWFASGDCKRKDMKRILAIIEILDKTEIKQIGFTRNVKLWEARKDIFALTVENKDEMLGKGLFAIPNYDEGETLLYLGKGRYVGGCGIWEYHGTINSIEHLVNCKSCMRLKVGCFMEGR